MATCVWHARSQVRTPVMLVKTDTHHPEGARHMLARTRCRSISVIHGWLECRCISNCTRHRIINCTSAAVAWVASRALAACRRSCPARADIGGGTSLTIPPTVGEELRTAAALAASDDSLGGDAPEEDDHGNDDSD